MPQSKGRFILFGGLLHKNSIQSIKLLFQVLLALGPFCSNPLRVTLTDCITNSSNDISIDTYAHSVIPVMKQFGLYDRDSIKFEIKINKRGAAPGGGGEVLLTMPNPKKLRPAVAFGKLDSVFDKIRLEVIL